MKNSTDASARFSNYGLRYIGFTSKSTTNTVSEKYAMKRITLWRNNPLKHSYVAACNISVCQWIDKILMDFFMDFVKRPTPIPSSGYRLNFLQCFINAHKGHLALITFNCFHLTGTFTLFGPGGWNEIRQKYQNFIRGDPYELGQTPLRRTKNFKSKTSFLGFLAS